MPLNSLLLVLCMTGASPTSVTVDVARDFSSLVGRAVEFKIEINGVQASLANGCRARLSIPISKDANYPIDLKTWEHDTFGMEVKKDSFIAPPGSTVFIELGATVTIKSINVFPPLDRFLYLYLPPQYEVSDLECSYDGEKKRYSKKELNVENITKAYRGYSKLIKIATPQAPQHSISTIEINVAAVGPKGKLRQLKKIVRAPGATNAHVCIGDGDDSLDAIRSSRSDEGTEHRTNIDRFVRAQIDTAVSSCLGHMAARPAGELAYKDFIDAFHVCVSELKQIDIELASQEFATLRDEYVDYFAGLEDLAKNGTSTPALVGKDVAVGVIESIVGLAIAGVTGGEFSMAEQGLSTLTSVAYTLYSEGGKYEAKLSSLEGELKLALSSCPDLELNANRSFYCVCPFRSAPDTVLYEFKPNSQAKQLFVDEKGVMHQTAGRYCELNGKTVISWNNGNFEIGRTDADKGPFGTTSYTIVDHSRFNNRDNVTMQRMDLKEGGGGFVATENPTEVPVKYRMRWFKRDGTIAESPEYVLGPYKRRYHWVGDAFLGLLEYDESFDDGWQTQGLWASLSAFDSQPKKDPMNGACIRFDVVDGKIVWK